MSDKLRSYYKSISFLWNFSLFPFVLHKQNTLTWNKIWQHVQISHGTKWKILPFSFCSSPVRLLFRTTMATWTRRFCQNSRRKSGCWIMQHRFHDAVKMDGRFSVYLAFIAFRMVCSWSTFLPFSNHSLPATVFTSLYLKRSVYQLQLKFADCVVPTESFSIRSLEKMKIRLNFSIFFLNSPLDWKISIFLFFYFEYRIIKMLFLEIYNLKF